jgi:hypothetical protein
MTSQDLHQVSHDLLASYLWLLPIVGLAVVAAVLFANRRVVNRLRANCPPQMEVLRPSEVTFQQWWALLFNRNVRWEEIYPPKSLPYIEGRSSQAGSQANVKRRKRPKRKHGAPSSRQRR